MPKNKQCIGSTVTNLTGSKYGKRNNSDHLTQFVLQIGSGMRPNCNVSKLEHFPDEWPDPEQRTTHPCHPFQRNYAADSHNSPFFTYMTRY